MFERFTERAREVVVHAQEESRLLNHGYIGTEHLLLGLFGQEGQDDVDRRLPGLPLSPEAVRNRIDELVGQGEDEPSGRIPFTPRAKRVLELSQREAFRLGSHSIDTGHLLLGLITEGKGLAVQVMTDLGVDLHEARRNIIAEMTSHTAVEDPAGDTRAGSVGGPNEVVERLDRIEAGLAALNRQLAAIQHQLDTQARD